MLDGRRGQGRVLFNRRPWRGNRHEFWSVSDSSTVPPKYLMKHSGRNMEPRIPPETLWSPRPGTARPPLLWYITSLLSVPLCPYIDSTTALLMDRLYLWDNLKLANHFSGRIDPSARSRSLNRQVLKIQTERREIWNATRTSAALKGFTPGANYARLHGKWKH